MIQRIQSVYLFLTAIFAGIFVGGRMLLFRDDILNDYFLKLDGLYHAVGNNMPENIQKVMYVTFIVSVILLGSLIIIFLFKNRKLQLKLTALLVGLILLLIIILAVYSISVINKFDVTILPGIYMLYPVLMFVFSYLAYRSIKKDEELVRSYDRLR